MAVQPRWHLSPRALLCPQFPSGPPACEGFWQPLAPRASSWLAPARLSGAGSPHLLCAHTHTLFFFLQGVQLRQQKEAERGLGMGFLTLPAGGESAATRHGKARYCRDCTQTPKSQPRRGANTALLQPTQLRPGPPGGHPSISGHPFPRAHSTVRKLSRKAPSATGEFTCRAPGDGDVHVHVRVRVRVSALPANPPTPSSPRGSSCAAPAPGDSLSGWACKVEQ